jgi:hypothetical protein
MRYYLDTEFNGIGGDLISLALVGEDGRELYLELPCLWPMPWVEQNVMPIIRCPGAEPMFCRDRHVGKLLEQFLATDLHPQIIADWPDDITYFCKALIVGPGQMVHIPSLLFEMVRVDSYPTDLPGAIQHNALWDARTLRHKIRKL